MFLDFNGRHYSSWSPGRAVTQVHFLSGLVSMRFDKKGKGRRRAFLFVFLPLPPKFNSVLKRQGERGEKGRREFYIFPLLGPSL